ncbi:hypothetical protein [Methanoculleus caldifontis]|uniref:hypothetical protein n=1 Tax=Methanoculleus caldifontis TaxID=2651577 RepID=UPI0029370D4C|nr:hypothetical protein [Methanoculleus sp. Wushi-C6]
MEKEEEGPGPVIPFFDTFFISVQRGQTGDSRSISGGMLSITGAKALDLNPAEREDRGQGRFVDMRRLKENMIEA